MLRQARARGQVRRDDLGPRGPRVAGGGAVVGVVGVAVGVGGGGWVWVSGGQGDQLFVGRDIG